MWNLLFLFSGFLFFILLVIIFYSKQKIDSKENRLFQLILFTNLLEYLSEIPVQLLVRTLDIDHLLVNVFTRLYLISIFAIFSVFTLYTFYISLKGDNRDKSFNIFKIIFGIYAIANTVVFIFLPLEKFYDGTKMYAYGTVVDYLKLQLGVYLLFWLIMVVINLKNILQKKYLPIIVVILLCIANVILQSYDPSVLIATVLGTYTCYTIFFTIENPDVKMIQQLNYEKDRADKANQAKSDFLSSMSHEIRTPLNAITGFSEMIMASETLEEAQENAKDIISASGTLLETVNGILDISKIESGKIELVEGDYNPYKMIDETVKLARGRLGDKPLDFQVNIAQDIPKVLYGDKFNIKKILINFLTNAIKYTDEGFVRFDVQCVKMNGMVRLIFIVSDSGRGIKKEDISKLFTKFQRLDEEKNQTIEGTGLGLAITKQLIEMMKGTVVVDSVYGEGSKFTFALDQKISEATLDDTTQKLDVVADLTGKKVLVVDDNKLNLKVADKLLKLYSISTTLSNSGNDCLDLIEDGNTFDLILLDDMMPQMSGIQTLENLKRIDGFNIPVVALTANAINGMKERYLDAGFDDYLPKPIVKEDLYRCLVRFLNPVTNNNEEVKKEKEINREARLTDIVEVKVPLKSDYEKTVPTTSNFKPYVPDNVEIVVKPGDSQKGDEPTTEEETNTSSDNSSKIILIVDDNNLNIKVETKLITSLGYTVVSANSGIEAINMVRNNKYDLIFMDIMMPMMDGVKTLHELQKLQGFNTPVVALTADAVLGAKEKYLSEGFNLYVTKPANKEDFDKIIKGFIK